MPGFQKGRDGGIGKRREFADTPGDQDRIAAVILRQRTAGDQRQPGIGIDVRAINAEEFYLVRFRIAVLPASAQAVANTS